MKDPENFNNADERWRFIYKAILDFASRNFEFPEYEPTKGDELDAMAEGIIMLGEELRDTTTSNEYLDDIHQSITDILIVLDKDLKIQAVNKAARELLEFSETDLKKLNLSHLAPEVIYRDEIKFAFSNSKEFSKLQNISLNLYTKSGRTKQVSASISQLSGGWKKGHDILFIAKDISRLMSVQRNLEERNQELSTLVYRISHDLRAPLSNILGLMPMLTNSIGDETAKTQDVLELIRMMNVSAFRLDKILMHFNEILYIEKASEVNSEIDFDEIISASDRRLREEFPERQFSIVHNVQPLSEPYKGPLRLLKTILFNIMHNSLFHNSKNSDLLVEINVKRRGHHLRISIADNGIGVPKEFAKDVFKMFSKASSVSSGSGLGLYFVKNVVHQLKGEVLLENREGQGLTIILLFPFN